MIKVSREVPDRPARRRGSAHAKYSVSHHMVIKPFLLLGLATDYRSRRWVWSTVVRQPSDVYDTHKRTKLTAPKTISRSRDVENRRLNLPTSIWRHVGDPSDPTLTLTLLTPLLTLTLTEEGRGNVWGELSRGNCPFPKRWRLQEGGRGGEIGQRRV